MSSLELHEAEERLRNAFAEKADSIEPAFDAWDQIQRRLAHRGHRRSHTRAYGAVAVAAAFAAAVGVLALFDHRDAGVVVIAPPTTQRPAGGPSTELCVTKSGLTRPKLSTKRAGALVGCPTFRHGKATIKVATKTYELGVLITNEPGNPWFLLWSRAGGGRSETAFEIVRLPDGTLRGPQLFEVDGQRVADRGCSTTISKFDATALEGTFDCPEFLVHGSNTTGASGSFSATP